MRTRVVSSVVMAVGLALTVYGGHVFLWVMLLAFQVIIARVSAHLPGLCEGRTR